MADRKLLDRNVAINRFNIDSLENLEASALAKAEDKCFDAALQNAIAMITTYPTSSRGYLVAGLLYSAHGQGQIAQEIYEEALATVDLRDEKFDDIVAARNAVCDTWDRVGVRVPELPPELLCNIIPSLPIETKLECTQVCKQLRGAIFCNPPIWHEVDGSYVDPTNLLKSTIPSIAHWVRRLSIGFYSSQLSFATIIMPYIHAGIFCNVQEFSMQFSAHVKTTILHQVLKQLGRKLIKLDLTIRSKPLSHASSQPMGWMISPASILAECPHLMHMKYVSSVWLPSLRPPAQNTFHHITSLHLGDSSRMRTRDVCDLIRLCPRIKSMILDTQLLVPKWKSLSRTHEESSGDNCHDMKHGLQRLHMVLDHITLNHLNTILRYSHTTHTLQELLLTFDSISGNEHLGSSLFLNVWTPQLSAENLTKLCCVGPSLAEQQQFIAKIVRSSQNIEHAVFRVRSAPLLPELVSSLACLVKLQCLEIEGEIRATYRRGVNVAFARFLGIHISAGRNSLLRTLVLQVDTVTNEVLERLPRLKMLHALVLAPAVGRFAGGGMDGLFTELSLAPTSLQSLSLEMSDAVRDSTLNQISRISTLKKVYFYKLPNITTFGTQRLINLTKSLKFICITDCSGVEASALAMDGSAKSKGIVIETEFPWELHYYHSSDGSFYTCDIYRNAPHFAPL